MTNRKPPSVYIIAGPNGAGKTTFAGEFLPHYAKCYEFVNADLIAGGLSPFAVEEAATQAARLMLERIYKLARQKKDFAFESTLSGRSYLTFLQQMRDDGYRIHIIYLWVRDISLALERIVERVRQGGHNVPADIVRRRFRRSIRNFLERYRQIADTWMIIDNSGQLSKLVAIGESGSPLILNNELYQTILQSLERS